MEPEVVVGGMEARLGAGVLEGGVGIGVEIVWEGETIGVVETEGIGVETVRVVQAINPRPATRVTITTNKTALLNLHVSISGPPKMFRPGSDFQTLR